MSRAQRLGLLALAVAVAAAAFVIVGTGGSDDDETGTSSTAPVADTAQSPTGTAPSAPPPPGPTVERVRLKDLAPVGGVRRIEAAKGDTVRFEVTADADDEIHLHGYDLYREVTPGKPARFVIKADIEGVFDIESHEAEHSGKDALIAKLVVEP